MNFLGSKMLKTLLADPRPNSHNFFNVVANILFKICFIFFSGMQHFTITMTKSRFIHGSPGIYLNKAKHRFLTIVERLRPKLNLGLS